MEIHSGLCFHQLAPCSTVIASLVWLVRAVGLALLCACVFGQNTRDTFVFLIIFDSNAVLFCRYSYSYLSLLCVAALRVSVWSLEVLKQRVCVACWLWFVWLSVCLCVTLSVCVCERAHMSVFKHVCASFSWKGEAINARC